MAKTVSLESLLRPGAKAWNKLRRSGEAPLEHTGATLTQISSAGADLSEMQLVGTEWDECELGKLSFRGADLSNAYFHGGVLSDCDFTGANLDGATFEEMQLVGCTFADANLEGATFERLGLTRCDLSDARALDTIECDEVALSGVEGFTGPEHWEGDPSCLGARLPLGYRSWPLEKIVAFLGEHVTVNVGGPADESTVRALEQSFRTSFPPDYRALLLAYGRMEIVGDPDLALGWLNVYGVGNLEEARDRFRSTEVFDEFGFEPGWLDVSVEDDERATARLAELRDRLALTEDDLASCVDDAHDEMRIAYQLMVPVLLAGDEPEKGITCIGPREQVYLVSVKDRRIEPPTRTFTSSLLRSLEHMIVAPG